MKNIHILPVLFAIILAGCSRSDSQTKKEDSAVSSDAPLHEIAILKEGDTAYARIKEYATEPMTNATPTGDKATLLFGDAVKLIQKKDGPVTFWLAAKDQIQAWIPAYILTANDAEVIFLRKINRIPEKMTFVPNDGSTAFGTVVLPLGMPSSSMVSEYSGGEPSQVMVLKADNGMPTPGGFAGVFAVKGNAVVFDPDAAKHQWKTPPVFDNAQKPFQISPACLYYCVADGTDGNKRAFECIDLVSLKVRK